jgi:hypothetical protein
MNRDFRESDGTSIRYQLLLSMMVLCVCVLVLVLLSNQLDCGSLVYPSCLFAAILLSWSLWSWRLVTGVLFTPYSIFLMIAWLFNSAQILLAIFDLNPDGLMDSLFSDLVAFQTILLSLLGLCSLHLGALAAAVFAFGGTGAPSGTPARAAAGNAVAQRTTVRVVGWGLLGVSIVPAILVIQSSLTVVMQSGYMGLYQRSTATGLEAGPDLLARYLVPGTILLAVGSKGRPFELLVSLGVLLLYVGAHIYMGFRAFAIMPVLSYAWAYQKSIRKLPLSLILPAGCILLFVVFPLIRATRLATGSDRLSVAYLYEAYKPISMKPINPSIIPRSRS